MKKIYLLCILYLFACQIKAQTLDLNSLSKGKLIYFNNLENNESENTNTISVFEITQENLSQTKIVFHIIDSTLNSVKSGEFNITISPNHNFEITDIEIDQDSTLIFEINYNFIRPHYKPRYVQTIYKKINLKTKKVYKDVYYKNGIFVSDSLTSIRQIIPNDEQDINYYYFSENAVVNIEPINKKDEYREGEFYILDNDSTKRWGFKYGLDLEKKQNEAIELLDVNCDKTYFKKTTFKKNLLVTNILSRELICLDLNKGQKLFETNLLSKDSTFNEMIFSKKLKTDFLIVEKTTNNQGIDFKLTKIDSTGKITNQTTYGSEMLSEYYASINNNRDLHESIFDTRKFESSTETYNGDYILTFSEKRNNAYIGTLDYYYLIYYVFDKNFDLVNIYKTEKKKGLHFFNHYKQIYSSSSFYNKSFTSVFLNTSKKSNFRKTVYTLCKLNYKNEKFSLSFKPLFFEENNEYRISPTSKSENKLLFWEQNSNTGMNKLSIQSFD
ncbi:MAG: hypothetical protein KA313_10640 [Pseudarcicella sp.]|nr:hypothetical protein [Pseudarcicella sp.]